MGLRRKTSPAADVPPRVPGDPLPADLLLWLEAQVPPAQRETVRTCLEAAVTADGQAAAPRLLRCAALASGGDPARLQLLVERLRLDWREVAVEAEYAVRRGKLVRVRDLTAPLES
jgi:hypothetical protein